ncbi:MAG: clan AA aspartic protease [Armatimonadota bacterium]|nr:clan AA aspartic protease [Armatimonadota bacterium]
MIFGEFTAFGQARIAAAIGSADGEKVEVSAVIDTGFMGALMLPRSLAAQLALPQIEQEILVMADGSFVRFAVHEAVISWQEEERTVAAHVSDGDALIGVELLRGSIGTIEFLDGGTVTLEAAE